MSEKKIPELALPMGLRLARGLPLPRKLGFLGRLYGKSLGRQGVVWAQTAAGPVWKLDLRNHTHRWLIFGDYEGPGFIPWARRWIRENSVVIDSGANIGQVLLYLAPKIGSGRYVAFEPFSPARAWLRECLSRHPVWRVEVEEAGLGAVAGVASLEGQWGGEEAVGSHTELRPGSGDIRMITLDAYAEARRLMEISLWKLDMEGSEEAALRGAESLLRQGKIKALVVETDQKRFPDLTALLAGSGYFPHDWSGRRMAGRFAVNHGNILFLPLK